MIRSHAERSIREAWPFTSAPPRRLVVKLGTNVLSKPGGGVEEERLTGLVQQIVSIRNGKGGQSTEVIVVTSGAVASGMGVMGIPSRPEQLPQLQGLAAIGQCRLMTRYETLFGQHGVTVAQLLLTRTGLEDRQRYLNAKYTLEALLKMGALPIVNENDTISTEELTFGDNDVLSSVIAGKMSADLLILLTDVDGLYAGNPAQDPGAQLLKVVTKTTREIEQLGTGPGSALGRGGMSSKIAAARHAATFGVATVIANGKTPGVLQEVLTGDFRGTLFLPDPKKKKRGRARAHWIAMRRPKGSVTIDDGARHALVDLGKSLLPVGITATDGTYDRGQVISVRDSSGEEVARGITNFSSEEVTAVMGRHGNEMAELLGHGPRYEEVVHRDNLHLRV